MTNIFTIGHSTHSKEHFLSLLQQHNITAIADVRSVPYSKFNPHFNQQELKIYLRQHNIKYVFLGKEFGARTENPECYVQGKVQYHKIAQTPEFKNGLNRIKKGVKLYNIALMCSEKAPLDCHRTILVSRYIIEKLHFNIIHILENGTTKTQAEVMNALLGNHDDLLYSPEKQLEQAYKKQEDIIAYQQL